MPYVVTTAPTVEPVTVAEAKLHLRVDHSIDDAMIGTMITAAREYCQNRSKRVFTTTAYRLDGYVFPGSACSIRLDKGPLIAVQSVKYYDTTGTLQTITSTNYRVDITPVFGQIVPIDGYVWPTVQSYRPDAVQVAFTAGYGAAATAVPAAAKQAMLLLIGSWYENRESVTPGTMTVVPYAVDSLVSTFSAPEFY